MTKVVVFFLKKKDQGAEVLEFKAQVELHNVSKIKNVKDTEV